MATLPRLLREEADSFILEGADGAAMPIAKNALSHDKVQELRSQLPQQTGVVSDLANIGKGIGSAVSAPLNFATDVAKEGVNTLGYLNPLEAARKLGAGEPLGFGQPIFQTRFNTPAAAPTAQPIADLPNAQLPTTATPQSVNASDYAFLTPQSQQSNSGISMPGMNTSGFDKQMNAINKQAEVGALKASEEAGFRNQYIKEVDDFEKKRQADEIQRQQELASKEQERDKAAAEAASLKIDNNRFWGSKSSGEKIGSIAGILLAGIGGGMQGNGKNLAIDALNREIDNDINAQKMDIEQQRFKVGEIGNTLTQMRQRFGDARAADAATKLSMYERVQNQIAASAAGYEDQNIKARAQEAMGRIEQEKNNLKTQFSLAMAAAQQKSQPDTELFVPGVGYAFSKTSANDVRDKVAGTRTFTQLMDKLIKLREKNLGILPGDAKAEMQSIAADLALAIKNNDKTGALDKGTIEVVEKIVKDPTGFGFKLDSYKAVKSRALQKLNNYLDVHIQPGTRPAQIQMRNQEKSE